MKEVCNVRRVFMLVCLHINSFSIHSHPYPFYIYFHCVFWHFQVRRKLDAKKNNEKKKYLEQVWSETKYEIYFFYHKLFLWDTLRMWYVLEEWCVWLFCCRFLHMSFVLVWNSLIISCMMEIKCFWELFWWNVDGTQFKISLLMSI